MITRLTLPGVLIFGLLIGSVWASSTFQETADVGTVSTPKGQGLLLAANVAVRITAPISSLNLKEPVNIAELSLPAYPATLRNAGIVGECEVLFDLNEDGSLGNIRPGRSSNQEFTDASLEAVKKWKMSPIKQFSKPKVIPATAIFVFSIYRD
jgi:TonB family protein